MRNSDKLILLAVALVALGSLWLIWETLFGPEYSHATQPLNTTLEPLQTKVVGVPLPIREYGRKRVFFDVQAAYTLTGTLVSKQRYLRGLGARLSPWDYAVAWGNIGHMLPYLRFSHARRFISFRYSPGAPVNGYYVQYHISNNHLVPATPNLRRALARGRKGQPIRLEGYLVNISATKGGRVVFTWNTSQTRADKGDGACEVFYVTRARLGEREYQ